MSQESTDSPPDDPTLFTAMIAIDNLLALLQEARKYVIEGNGLAALGTLIMFDEHAADLKAAIRFLQMERRRK
jgi:hypothetical protein